MQDLHLFLLYFYISYQKSFYLFLINLLIMKREKKEGYFLTLFFINYWISIYSDLVSSLLIGLNSIVKQPSSHLAPTNSKSLEMVFWIQKCLSPIPLRMYFLSGSCLFTSLSWIVKVLFSNFTPISSLENPAKAIRINVCHSSCFTFSWYISYGGKPTSLKDDDKMFNLEREYEVLGLMISDSPLKYHLQF